VHRSFAPNLPSRISLDNGFDLLLDARFNGRAPNTIEPRGRELRQRRVRHVQADVHLREARLESFQLDARDRRDRGLVSPWNTTTSSMRLRNSEKLLLDLLPHQPLMRS